MGCPNKTRFGALETYEPVFRQSHPGRTLGRDRSDRIQKRQADNVTCLLIILGFDQCLAAFRTWPFRTTGLDGLEETEFIREAFDLWKQQPQNESFFVKSEDPQ